MKPAGGMKAADRKMENELGRRVSEDRSEKV